MHSQAGVAICTAGCEKGLEDMRESFFIHALAAVLINNAELGASNIHVNINDSLGVLVKAMTEGIHNKVCEYL